jgi:hypothetical protein
MVFTEQQGMGISFFPSDNVQLITWKCIALYFHLPIIYLIWCVSVFNLVQISTYTASASNVTSAVSLISKRIVAASITV